MSGIKSVTKLLGAGVAMTGALLLVGNNAIAAPITSAIGGIPNPTGHPSIQYENFNGLSLGSNGGTTSTGIIVSFGNDGKVVKGSRNGLYAAPYLSNKNGTLFGDSQNKNDKTHYLSSGSTGAHPGAYAKLVFPHQERYLGLLWGSVDTYNTLRFYNSGSVFNQNTLITSYTGSDVSQTANGDRGKNGTYYVNFNLDLPFKSVVATSSKPAFEFDNVAFSTQDPSLVSEPDSLGLFALGLLMLGLGALGRKCTSV